MGVCVQARVRKLPNTARIALRGRLLTAWFQYSGDLSATYPQMGIHFILLLSISVFLHNVCRAESR